MTTKAPGLAMAVAVAVEKAAGVAVVAVVVASVALGQVKVVEKGTMMKLTMDCGQMTMTTMATVSLI